MENPRQFASLVSSDAGLHGSLTNRPPNGVPSPVNNRFLESLEKEYYSQQGKGAFVPQESPTEYIHRLQGEQTQRNDLRNRISGSDVIEAEFAQPARRESPSQIQRSTPERQPLPSTGAPPPTFNGTGVRADALIEPTATPRPAMLREAIAGTVGGLGQSLPKSLPQAAGRFVIPGVGVGLTFAGALIAGQSVQQAATTTVIVTTGSVVGGVIGAAIGGPIGLYVGSAIGGFAAGYLASALIHPVPSTAAHLEVNTPNYPPFLGGQVALANYRVEGTYDIYTNGVISGTYTDAANLTGAIGGIRMISEPQGAGFGFVVSAVDWRTGLPKLEYFTRGGSLSSETRGLRSISVTYISGGGVEAESPVNLENHAPPPDNLPYRYNTSPIGDDNTVPSGTPAAGKKRGNTRNVAPSMPVNNTPNGNAFFPGHGGLAPSYLPNPEYQPSNLGGMLPQQQPQQQMRQLLPFAEPEDLPVARVVPPPGLLLSQFVDPGIPVSFDPRISSIQNGIVTSPAISTAEPIPLNSLLPSSPPKTTRQNPIPDALSPVPKTQTLPIVKTPEQVATDKTNATIEQQKKSFEEQAAQITIMAGILAGLTPIIKNIPNAIAESPTVQAANRATTQGAVCEIAQPGGCLGDALDNNASNINQNNNRNTNSLLDKINAGANAAQLALLELMNTKLGDLIPGGLSGKLQRLSSWMHLDRVLNILIWWQTLHNAYMLSANLGQTLTSAISNVLAAIGIKDAEGSPLEIGEILGHQFDSLAKNVIGETEWGGIKAEYKKWNRIYQAAANILNAVQSIGYSILSALQVVGSYVALVGNALRKWGEVGESAYRWFNPQPNFHNKFFTTLEATTNVVSQIDQVASEVLSVEDNVTQIGQLKNELNKSLSEEPESKQGTIPPEAVKVKASDEALKAVSATGLAISDLDKEADE
ncbi:hypothetical protein [Nostoc sp.]|uniref:hypothetical protein n=1 Tax=Nostoc sp. TaxID=1180 RepID=UPI002FFC4B35